MPHNVVTKTDKFCRTRCKSRGGINRAARSGTLELNGYDYLGRRISNNRAETQIYIITRALRDRDAIRSAREGKESIKAKEKQGGGFSETRGTIPPGISTVH